VLSWRVLDYGAVPAPPATTGSIDFTCTHCGLELKLPVVGRVIAQIGDGLVWDLGPRAMPKVIQCRNCRRMLEAV
jgi:hypothetical protein